MNKAFETYRRTHIQPLLDAVSEEVARSLSQPNPLDGVLRGLAAATVVQATGCDVEVALRAVASALQRVAALPVTAGTTAAVVLEAIAFVRYTHEEGL